MEKIIEPQKYYLQKVTKDLIQIRIFCRMYAKIKSQV
jgi:hypothetical protein